MKMSADGEFLLYQAPDGKARIQVRLQSGTLWMTQKQLAQLYQVSVPAITQHIRHILSEGELETEATVKSYLIVAPEATRSVERRIAHYSLDMVLAVGYRVRSHRGTQFRQWATEQIKTYLTKGFLMDDTRLKHAADDDYFDELLSRIRDIRSSERNLWRKVQDIYTTSIDYDPKVDVSQAFFATLQNKMHFAAHKQTAAELIYSRANASSPHMGLTSWKEAERGGDIRSADIAVAKNYLDETEIKVLNLIVSQYLDFAELQALERRPMTMKDWVASLEGFLQAARRELLPHAGLVSHEVALTKAREEFERFQMQRAQLTLDTLPELPKLASKRK
jgi:hypothetical protein